jgi:hypothetical protein
VLLDHLPEPVPHMQFALGEYETLGATSAGKALGARRARAPTVLHALLGGDVEGERVRAAPRRVGRRADRGRRRHHRAATSTS